VKERSELAADTYTLCLETQNYHWIVTGSMFNTLHTLSETHAKKACMLRSHLESGPNV
jgi:DNA-binding ferritin-like protein